MLDETQNNALNAAIESYQNTGAAVLPDDFNARIGDGDYVAIGTEFLQLLVEHSGLKPEAQVLDIGCGLGRVAQPLKHFLAPGGRYTGLDVVAENVTWCQQHLGNTAQGFDFIHLDVAHPLYNPAGKIAPEDTFLPFTDNHFDCVMMVSVFTHLAVDMTAQYMAEVRRVLRPGGRLFATFFLINPESRVAADKDYRYPFDLRSSGPIYTPPDDHVYGAAAVEEDWLTKLACEVNGFTLVKRCPGHWSQITKAPERPYQDILVFEK